MGVMEVNADGSSAKYARSNRAFRDFMKRTFHFDLANPDTEYPVPAAGPGSGFMQAISHCMENNTTRTFVDEEVYDGSNVHSFVRVIGKNPVTGKTAVAIAILSITPPDDSTTYAEIARALAADYYNIYVVDLDTNDYIEYISRVGGEELSRQRHGGDFFESAQRDAMTRVYEEDREQFLKWFTRENVLHELDTQGVFTVTYRQVDTGTPLYINMKITRMHGGNRIIIGISNIDAQMKQQAEEKKLLQERLTFGRIAALSPNYIVLYTVDPETGHYTQYNPASAFENIGLSRQGDNFFTDVRLDAPKAIESHDLERHLRMFTKEIMLREIKKNGFFIHNYRLRLDGKTVPVSLRATMVEEEGKKKLLLGVLNDDKEEYSRALEEAYEQASRTSVIFTHIAQALARGYTDLYYVNMDTDELIEYHTDDDLGVLNEARRSSDFFEGCRRDVKKFVHPEDQDAFVRAMDREFLRNALEHSRVYEMTYRRIKDGRSFYVQMRVSRIEDDRRYIVIAVSDVDELVRKRRAEERIQEERIIYARLHALTGNFICVYVVDPDTGSYREFSATRNYEESFAQAKEGTDFFGTVRSVAHNFQYPDELSRFLSLFTKENVMTEIERSGIFTLGYRLNMDGTPLYVQMKAAMVEEKEGPRLIVGLNNIDAQVRQEQEFGRRLALAKNQANIDALTGVRNRNAYLEVIDRMDSDIAAHTCPPFAIVMLDVNDLKKVNDLHGHQAGDRYLRDACKIICDIFKHSPIFRVGGDEFVVIAQGQDYDRIDDQITTVEHHNETALHSCGIVIACGMAKFENDTGVSPVFQRADLKMYNNKTMLKSVKQMGK